MEILLVAAGLIAGVLNVTAAGGSLVSFIILWNMGIPALQANITNLIATPASFIGAWVKKRPKLEIKYFIPSVMGTIVGVVILLNMGPSIFKSIAPYLIIGASILLALQPLFKELRFKNNKLQALFLFLAGIYTGVFGGAAGTLFLLIVLFTTKYSLHEANAKKNAIALGTSVIGCITLAFLAQVSLDVLWLALGMLVGGYFGVLFVDKINSSFMRWTVVISSLLCALWWITT
jgi:uncharacterized protein